VIHALQAQERQQRRLMRKGDVVEGVLLYIGENVVMVKNNKTSKDFSSCPYCEKNNHQSNKCSVEARCKMPQMWSTWKCEKDL